MVIDHYVRLRILRMRTKEPGNSKRYTALSDTRKHPLTYHKAIAYTSGMTLKRDLLESFVRDIDANFQAEVDARMKEVRRELEVDRRKAIEALYKAWPQMGGSEKDLDVLTVELQAPLDGLSSESSGNDRQSKRSGGQTVPMNVVRQEVQEVLEQAEYDVVVTQTEIKDRIVDKYPDAKIPSVRSAISRLLSGYLEQGELELVEEGKAGAPNRYRKKRREVEATILNS